MRRSWQPWATVSIGVFMVVGGSPLRGKLEGRRSPDSMRQYRCLFILSRHTVLAAPRIVHGVPSQKELRETPINREGFFSTRATSSGVMIYVASGC
jgi:hypothetical protein